MTIIDYFEHADNTDVWPDKFHGGAIIDGHGKEIPITETMIQHVLTAFEDPESNPLATVINGQ